MKRNRFALTLIVVTLLTLTVAVANYGSVHYPHRGDNSLPTTASAQTPPTEFVFSDGFENGWDIWTYDSPLVTDNLAVMLLLDHGLYSELPMLLNQQMFTVEILRPNSLSPQCGCVGNC